MDNNELILSELERARKSLLDLTMRNRLLNHRPSKARTIKVVDELPREVYNLLVIENGTMEFLPRQESGISKVNGENSDQTVLEDSGLSEKEQHTLWTLPESDLQPETKYTDKYLQTNYESEVLQKRLFKISSQSKLFYEEQGYSILYLALGFLRWKESRDSIDHRKAPLILVPVELDRVSVGRPFKLKWTGDEVLTNISLQAKLTEQSIELPEFEMPEDKQGIVNYLKDVTDSINKRNDWDVLSDICLDFFSFAKFIMYRDLDPNSWSDEISPVNNPLIRAILDPSSASSSIPGFNEEEIDERLSSKDVYHVMDADPSQIAVIEDIKSGRNLVVEGPPGTGKSQTITNVIAELMAAGKTTLFVSEKMAALNVVKNRMDKVGLGMFCLEIHSNKAKKSEILAELQRAANSQSGHVRANDLQFEDHQRVRDYLNEYAKVLREPFRDTGYTPYEMLSDWLVSNKHFIDVGRPAPEIKYEELPELTESNRNEADRILVDLKEILELLGSTAQNPWRGCKPPVILPGDEIKIEQSIDELIQTINKVMSTTTELSEHCGTRATTEIRDIERVISAATVVAKSMPTDQSVLINDEWNVPSDLANELISEVLSYQTQYSELSEIFIESAFTQPVADKLEVFRLEATKLFRILSSNYRSLKKEIRSWFKEKPPKKNSILIEMLEELSDNIKHREMIEQKDKSGSSLFGSHWKGISSDASLLSGFSEWIVQYRKQLLNGALSENSSDKVSHGVDQKRIEELVEGLKSTESALNENLQEFTPLIGLCIEDAFGCDYESLSIAELNNRLNNWKQNLSSIHHWVKYCSISERCSLLPIAYNALKAVDTGSIEDARDLIPAVRASLAHALLRLVFSERPIFQVFIGEDHEKKIHRFHELEKQLMDINRLRVQESVVARKPKFYEGSSQNSQVGILIGEFKKKRRHLPIRKLMSAAGSTIQKIKPCFMMSPQSIAQFLDPSALQFDVIVFDEASQVKPEDALGAMLRGKQLAVLGDTRQLPPTSFFNHIVDDEAVDDEQPITGTLIDMESILHRCSQCFPPKMLSWHYRSRHESLIAVSNYEFYDNRLLVFPSPTHTADSLGLKLIHVKDGVYDRGKSQINRIEARTVAKHVAEHYLRTKGNLSLGVGTFSQKQKDAIDEEIELQKHQLPDLEIYMKKNRFEPFFVKNLETIQGDERDVIFVSIGYGKEMDGQLRRNFGPLNHDGGERRLNVLITRARQKCIVFSNFRAEDLNVKMNERFGVRALRSYLEFAECGKLQAHTEIKGDTDSVFEDSVYEFLRSNGIEAHKQVGCSRYWIDLAVIDAEHPGRYLLGIECDGAQYHSSRVARERDRLREQVLLGQGWKIHRVWSTDWFRNRTATERKLLEAVESAKLNINNGHLISNDSGLTPLKKTDLEIESNEFVNETSGFKTIFDDIPAYAKCNDLGVVFREEIHDLLPSEIAEAVKRVTEVESPVHIDEVITRIRTLSGYARAGQRMRNAIFSGIQSATKSGFVRSNNSFLWSVPVNRAVVRRRGDTMALQAEYISDEEITEAFKRVLSLQGATPEEDLILQASRLLGFQRTTSETTKRFQSVLRKLLRRGLFKDNAAGQLVTAS